MSNLLSGRLNRLKIAQHERRIRSLTAEMRGRLTEDEVREIYYRSVRSLARHPELSAAMPGESQDQYVERIVRGLAADNDLTVEETERVVARTQTLRDRVRW